MQKNKWSRKFDWVKSGTTYTQQNRLEQITEKRFINVSDIYFKTNKYLTGVSFSYINSLSDIYKRDLLTGDGYSVYNMYNEYDVIDRVLKNIVLVDIASNTNIDLRSQWHKIDGIQLRPGHLILLYNQNSEFENDIYQVTQQYFLINAGFLSTREKSNKFSCSVKMGSNFDRQFFLINNGLNFPITFEPKYFLEGKSFILKNLVKYNLYNTSSNSAITSKIIFTDYDIARKQLINNYALFANINLTVPTSTPTTSYVSIHYHHDEYIIRKLGFGYVYINGSFYSGTTNPLQSGYTYTIISGGQYGVSAPAEIYEDDGAGYPHDTFTGTLFNTGQTFTWTKVFPSTYWRFNNTVLQFNVNSNIFVGPVSAITNMYEGITSIPYKPNFAAEVGDYVNLRIFSGTTDLLLMNTFLKTADGFRLYLEENITNRILTDLKPYQFEIRNLSVATGWTQALDYLQNYTPYLDFYSSSGTTNLVIKPLESKFDRYFDYGGLTFLFDDDNISLPFYTNIHYAGYTLYNRLHDINPEIFTSTFSGISNSYLLPITDYEYTDNNRIRLSTTITGLTTLFKPYTYVEMNGDYLKKTLIYDVTNNHIVIEKPAGWINFPPTAITSIKNIDGLLNISNLLYEVYINADFEWYIQKSDNERKYIARAYGDLLSQNDTFRKSVTGILYENEKNEFIFKLYDLETDRQLSFSPVELAFIGADRKTRLPVPLKMIEASGTTFNLDWNVLDGGLDDPLYREDVFDFGFNNVLGGPNDPAPIYTIIDGN